MQENVSTTTNASDFQQFLTFKVSDEEFCIELMSIHEIREWTKTTPLPNSPDFMKGVINLRGAVIPVFDLKCRFEMGKIEPTVNNRIIVLAIEDDLIGLLVDDVSDIIDVSGDQIKTVPHVESRINQDYINGIISVNEKMAVILNINNIFGTNHI